MTKDSCTSDHRTKAPQEEHGKKRSKGKIIRRTTRIKPRKENREKGARPAYETDSQENVHMV